MDKTFRHYWDDIKKNFILYSLVPLLALVFVGYPLLYLSFMQDLYQNNRDYNKKISYELEKNVDQYTDIINSFAERREIGNILKGSETVKKEKLYEEIYKRLRETSLLPHCFVVSADGEVMMTTTTQIPDYIKEQNFSKLGIGRRMAEDTDRVVVERCASQWGKAYSMCAGRAVRQDGELLGFVILELPGENMRQLLQQNSSYETVVADKFGYLFSGNISDNFIQHNKLAAPLRNGNGKVTIEGRVRYVTSTRLADGQINVYVMMDIDYLDKMFFNIGILLLAIASVFTALLLITSQRFARRKSKILDDMVAALRKVRKGDLNTRLEADSQDELQLFAEEYNRMLTELKELMRINEEVVRQTVITEIKQLESQFNPHFLYNTLGNIKYMTVFDTAGAQKMIDDLSEILRYSIRTVESLSRLDEDLQYTRSYLDILKYRFRDALRWSVNIEEETLDCFVPKLIIQPVIENAINYGFRSQTVLSIDINAVFCDGMLVLTIKNDGVGMEPEKLEEVMDQLEQEHDTTRHIGLYNIHRRIQLLYGREYGVKIESSPERGTSVIIRFPAKKGEVG